MENNKKDDKKSGWREKFDRCKDHCMIMPIAAVIILAGVFAIGLAVGHEGRHESGGRFDKQKFGRGGCMDKGFFQYEKGGRKCKYHKCPFDLPESELNEHIPGSKANIQTETNKPATEDATSTSQDLNNTSAL